jgi:hypothetical protein
MRAASKTIAPPEMVLLHKSLHNWHFFETFGHGRYGRLTVDGRTLLEAYGNVADALSKHVTAICGQTVTYRPKGSFAEFEEKTKRMENKYATFVLASGASII